MLGRMRGKVNHDRVGVEQKCFTRSKRFLKEEMPSFCYILPLV